MPELTDLAQGTNSTAVNPTTYNAVIDRINTIAGYTGLGSAVDAFYNPYLDGVVGDGVTSENTAVAAADAAAVIAGQGLLFIPGTYLFDDNLTIDSYVALMPGATFSIASGKTVTFAKGHNDPGEQMFTGDGTVAYSAGSLPTLRPEWFGGKADNSTDNCAAFQWCLDILKASSGGALELSYGTYIVHGSLLIDGSDISIKGVGNGTLIIETLNASDLFYTDDSKAIYNILFANLQIKAANGVDAGAAIYGNCVTYAGGAWHLDNVRVYRVGPTGGWDYGFRMRNVQSSIMNDCYATYCNGTPGYGWGFEDHANAWTLNNCVCAGGSNYGVYSTSNSINLFGGTFQGTTVYAGVRCSGYGMSIHGTWFEGTGIAIDAPGIQGLHISGCNISRTAGTSVMVADAGTDYITLSTREPYNSYSVSFTVDGGVLPAPLVAGTLYYVINPSGSTFQVSLTPGGAAINITDAGSGTQTATFSDNTIIGTTSATYGTVVNGNSFGPGYIHIGGYSYGTSIFGNRTHSGEGTIVDNGDDSTVLWNYRYTGTVLSNKLGGDIAFTGANTHTTGSLTASSGITYQIADLYAPSGVRMPFHPERSDAELILDMALDEEGSVASYDTSRYNHNGAITGGTYVAGPYGGKVLNFDGATTWVNIPDAASLRFGTSDFTVEYYCYDTGGPDNGHILAKDAIYGNGKWGITGGNTHTFGSSDEADNPTSAASNIPVTNNTWTHIAWVKTGDDLERWKNGVNIGTVVGFFDATADFDSTEELRLGCRSSGDQLWTGRLGGLKLYKRALSEGEVQTHYLRANTSISTVINDEFRIVGVDGTVDFGVIDGSSTLQSDSPTKTLHNNTEEDADGGRESSVLFKGEQSGGEKTTLAKIESSHSGAADDEKGQLKIYTNDGNDADAPTLAVTVDSVQCLSVVGDIAAAGGFRKPFPFMQIDVAANQAAVAIDVAGLAGNTEYMVPYAGSVIAITVASNDARTAGTLTVDATINGTVTGLQAVLDADPTTYAYTVQAKDLDALVAGDRLGVKITTDGDWAPITADILVTVEVEG